MNGTYEVTIYGQMGGKYEITITLGDVPLGCPVIIPVIKVLVMTIGCEGTSWGQYRNPCAVAMNVDNDIVSVDRSNKRLQIVTKEGICKKILEFKQFETLFSPCDIAISDDNTYYTLDNNNKQVVVSDENGHVRRTFGNNELKDPQDIAISPSDGNVYVTDLDGPCVKIYTPCGKYLRSFGSKGKGRGEFDLPFGIVIGKLGMVFVADHWNKRIHVFNWADQHLFSFVCTCEERTLAYQRKLSIENDKYIYVTTDHPSSLLKFEISGRFVCRIDKDEDGLDYPNGVALTDDVPCRVVVADRDNHCIKVFVQ
ncbi:tripartite motif-containing protein 2-like [Ptychodera flava]|uniref:tripartite motif-containing protein 2-like n=1 Tax=Ptychodera flava TaxID=63121 RepID=UPI00396A5B09